MEALVRLVVARPRTVLLVTAVLSLVSLWRLGKLRLDTDFAQLLPRHAPAVAALAELDRRAVAAAGVRINFLNFIALPITFGIATDYSANLYLRYRQEGRGHLPRVIASTGGAVALCSLTTIIGYGALLLADTRGLRSFGAAAIAGELACLTTALVLMPAVIAITDGEDR